MNVSDNQIVRAFEAQGLDSYLAVRLLNGLSQTSKSTYQEKMLCRQLERLLRFDSSLTRLRALALVGEPGAGKTATAAKLAARLRLAYDIRVGLVEVTNESKTQSSFLEEYAARFGLRHRSLAAEAFCESPSVLAHFQDCQLVILDIAASDSRGLNGPAAGLRRIPDSECMLVLSAAQRSDAQAAAIRRYEPYSCSGLIVSGLDQSAYAGELINTLHNAAKRIAFFGVGPGIPSDIEPAGAMRLIRMLTQQVH
jgi:flagellar biosynthesis protein FlhF